MSPDRIRVGISGLPLGNRSGTGYYTEQLMRVLTQVGDDRIDVSLLSPDNLEHGNAFQRNPSVGRLHLRWPFRVFADRLLDKNIRALDLVHYPNCIGPPITSKPIVATLHDISPFACPEFFSTPTGIYLRKAFSNVSRAARIVITDSHWQADRIRDHLPELSSKIRVVYPTLAADYSALGSSGSSDPKGRNSYFLMVGTLEPRKQIDLAIRSWENSDVPVDLILVGRWGWMTEEIRRTLKRIGPVMRGEQNESIWSLPDGRKVHHLQDVGMNDLIDLYRGAVALVYPSKFEGFGLPVLEAMTLGCPVLTRRESAMEEIVGSAGWYFSEDSKEELASAMEELFGKPDKRHGRSVVGRELAKNFSEKRFYEDILSAYEGAITGTT